MNSDRGRVLEEHEWQCLNEAVRRWEDSRTADGGPHLAPAVPPPSHPLRSRALLELIKIDQDYRFQSRRPKLLEDYISEWPELASDDDLLAELLEAECLTRMLAGDAPAVEELRRRFPSIANRVDLSKLAAEVNRENGQPQSPKPSADGDASQVFAAETPSERYHIRGVLGRGAMGVVFRAYDVQLDREVALKVPSTDLSQDPNVWERLCSEAKALAQIRHRNVCQVFDVGQSHGRYYISMALISGQSLAARLRERPMDCREAAALVQKLADALAAAHAAGIIHRDLKPQNVMLDGEGEPLLTDFGLARPIQAGDHLTGSHSPHGTPAYMAPELLRGEPASTASDIYALGAILYQALTGRLPFHGTMPDILTKIARGNPTPPSILRPEIDDELERICLKAMARRPSERYAYARQVADALAAYLQSPRKDSKHSRVEQWMTAPAACSPPQAGAGDHSLRHRNSWLTVANLAIVILVCANCMLLFLLYSGDHHGVLVLEVSPDNASVLIDQQVYRFEPPRDAILLPAGEHRLEVKRQGFCGESSLVRIERGKKVELNVKLKPE